MPDVKTTFAFSVIEEKSVLHLLLNLQKKKLQAKLLHTCAYGIYKPLTKIFNRCISDGVFPQTFKYAKVIPIFKSGDKTECANYRPVSILSSLSKILEKLLHDQLMSIF